MFKGRVLFPHDGSEAAGAVMDGLGLALGADTPVTILHVDEGPELLTPAIDAAQQHIEGYGAQVERVHLEAEDVAGAIVDYIGEHRPAVVVMSAQGHGARASRLRGTISERVMHNSPMPVLMLGPSARVEPHFQSMLVPVEAQVGSLSVLDTLLPLAQSFKSSITLLYVDSDGVIDTDATRRKRRAARRAKLESEFAQTLERIRDAGLEAHLRIEYGEPDEQILAAADPEVYDLLAMTTHARTGVSRWLLGSVAHRVLQNCRLPVYLQRVAEPA